MSKKIIDRYIWLIETVVKAGEDGITYKDINKRWMKAAISNGEKYPLRTFHNHRSEISTIFNIDIACNSVTNTYYIDLKKLRKRHSKSNKLLLSFLAGLSQDTIDYEETDDINVIEAKKEKTVKKVIDKDTNISNELTNELDSNPIEIQLQIYSPLKEQIKSNPIHHSQKEISSTSSSIIISLLLNPSDSFNQLILSYGDQAEILSPNSLRKDITDIIGKAMKRYTAAKPAKKKKEEKDDGIIELW
ncbi:MAG: WYL domain-containing protein [Bacteroidales bacterium]|jgi:hypothetical protein|nr:WYL domain-containing protein [Bacteroidales bacterium]